MHYEDDERIIKDIKEKLGDEVYEELVDKDWKIAKAPRNYTRRRGKDGRKLNVSSLKNLVQYRERTREEKELALKQLKYKEKKDKEDKPTKSNDKKELKKEYKVISLVEKLKKILPIKEFLSEDEQSLFFDMIDFFIQDFEESDLKANDIDDLILLAQNKVLEVRLLKHGITKPKDQIDVFQAIEKLRKQTEKAKENLLARRKDRLSGKDLSTFSIIDLVAAYENKEKEKIEDRVKMLIKNEEDFIKSRKESSNKYDSDADLDDDIGVTEE